MGKVEEIFGSMVFNDSVMRARLPKETYKALKRAIAENKPLSLDVAHVVAAAMKEWAIEKGAVNFTHWFQPMTGITAEKHDAFISPVGDGTVILEFSGKELVKGEPDASSFPSGGLRETAEARGYTVWDPTSYAFVKDTTLYIPTAFCSYGGEALDMKTPLLRSIEALDRQAVRVLKLLGNTSVKHVATTVGPEQEYFLIDKDAYAQRPDLIFAGRTLFGARSPKGQEMEDQYFASIRTRVKAFMLELNEELWKLGVLAKTEHNEVAPAQHELAPIYSTTNVATDHNQLTMEMLKAVAERHDLACLLHEKPFAGINGSGKHNNWSISTDSGENLFDLGDTPSKNAQFLLFLAAVIKAVDEHQDMMRVTVASAANDHRLGANEAPPAIVSIFLGEELTEIVEAIETGTLYKDKQKIDMEIGVTVLPRLPKDTTDRNRTSPFAFTGNKFEFRMVGSAFSIAFPNTVLNTIVAESLSEMADALEKSKNFKEDLAALIKSTIIKHKRIIFNGNNYSPEWEVEAAKRGLLNLKNTVDALPSLVKEENIKMFSKHGVLSESEIHSRYEVQLENYCKTINIEALTMTDMVKKSIVPAIISYQGELASVAASKKAIGDFIPVDLEVKTLEGVSKLGASLYKKLEALDAAIIGANEYDEAHAKAKFIRDNVITAMSELREVVDELELRVAADYWPFPTYGEMLFYVD